MIDKQQPMRPALIDVVDALETIDESIGGIDTDISGLVSRVGSAETFIQNFEGETLPNINTALSDLATDIDTINDEDIPDLDRRINAASDDAGDALAQATLNAGAIETLNETTIPAINERITSLASDVTDAQSDIDDINNDTLPDIISRLEDEETYTETLQTSTIPGINTDIDTINNTTIPALAAAISSTLLWDSYISRTPNASPLQSLNMALTAGAITKTFFNTTIPAHSFIIINATYQTAIYNTAALASVHAALVDSDYRILIPIAWACTTQVTDVIPIIISRDVTAGDSVIVEPQTEIIRATTTCKIAFFNNSDADIAVDTTKSYVLSVSALMVGGREAN